MEFTGSLSTNEQHYQLSDIFAAIKPYPRQRFPGNFFICIWPPWGDNPNEFSLARVSVDGANKKRKQFAPWLPLALELNDVPTAFFLMERPILRSAPRTL